MGKNIRQYRSAHKGFLEFGNQVMSVDGWELFHQYTIAEKALLTKAKELAWTLPDSMKLGIVLDPEGIKALERLGMYESVIDEARNFREAYQALLQPNIEVLAQIREEFPLTKVAIDVLIEKGLSVTRQKIANLGIAHQKSYKVVLNGDLSDKVAEFTLLHEACHLFYVIPALSRWIGEINPINGATNPIENAYDEEATKTLQREPKLIGYILERCQA
jgi:hypothetical protein